MNDEYAQLVTHIFSILVLLLVTWNSFLLYFRNYIGITELYSNHLNFSSHIYDTSGISQWKERALARSITVIVTGTSERIKI